MHHDRRHSPGRPDSELHSAVASLSLLSTVLRSGAASAGLRGSISATAEVIASLHCARSSLIISSGSQAALGPAERNKIRAAWSVSCLLMVIILVGANCYFCSSVAGPAGFDGPSSSEKVTTRNGLVTVEIVRTTCRDRTSMTETEFSKLLVTTSSAPSPVRACSRVSLPAPTGIEGSWTDLANRSVGLLMHFARTALRHHHEAAAGQVFDRGAAGSHRLHQLDRRDVGVDVEGCDLAGAGQEVIDAAGRRRCAGAVWRQHQPDFSRLIAGLERG